MKCYEVKPLILNYFEKDISSENAGFLSEHIKTCSDCSSDLINIGHLDSLLKEENSRLLLNREYYLENLNSIIYKRIHSADKSIIKSHSYKLNHNLAYLIVFMFISGYFLFVTLSFYKPIIEDKNLAINSSEILLNNISEEELPLEAVSDETIYNSEYFKNEADNLMNSDDKIIPSLDFYSYPMYSIPEIESVNINTLIKELDKKEFI